jgi:hypothetical protein
MPITPNVDRSLAKQLGLLEAAVQNKPLFDHLEPQD